METLSLPHLFIGSMSIIGILLGIIWQFIRSEQENIKNSVKKNTEDIDRIEREFMSKKDCERIMELNNGKNC